MKNRILSSIAPVCALCVLACSSVSVKKSITNDEASLINESSTVMRILTADNEKDLAVLHTGTVNLNVPDINSPEYDTLVCKMTATLKACGDDVLFLTAPQVGISRRLAVVRRTDKEGAPIEVYPNLSVTENGKETVSVCDSCISVPGKKSDVTRLRNVTICYTDIHSDRIDAPRNVWEDVSGDMALVFQHAADHLQGVLLTDKN